MRVTPQACEKSEALVFINYRREDSSGYAGRLYEWLGGRFGPERVRFD